MAFFHTELTRDGPGLMLRDIERGNDPQVAAVVDVIVTANPDILVVWGIDWDAENRGIRALLSTLKQSESPLEHAFTQQPNRGIPTGIDIDGNGSSDHAEDAQSFGEFTGENGMAILARWPIQQDKVQDHSLMLWRELPDALLPWPGMPPPLLDVYRLASTSHWVVPIQIPDSETVWLGTFAASTPVFDGPEDRNGRRNHDELMFWHKYLSGRLSKSPPDGMILAGHANLDPLRGDGRRDAIRALLNHPKLQDGRPLGAAGELTVDWNRDDLENMRLSYILPTHDWEIVDAGVFWPAPDHPQFQTVKTASRHRLVWMDLRRQK